MRSAAITLSSVRFDQCGRCASRAWAGDRPQVGPVGLESLRQPFVLVHWSQSPVAFRYSSDERNPAGVTTRNGGDP